MAERNALGPYASRAGDDIDGEKCRSQDRRAIGALVRGCGEADPLSHCRFGHEIRLRDLAWVRYASDGNPPVTDGPFDAAGRVCSIPGRVRTRGSPRRPHLRGPLREALARLAEKGLVIAIPQRGFRARDMSVQDILALTEARVQIEALTLHLSIKRGDIHWETGVLASHHVLEDTPVELDDGQFNEDWAARHHAFHRALLSGCANPHLEMVCSELRDCTELYRHWYWSVTDDSDRDIATEHRLLKELTLARKTDAARALLRMHIERAPLKLVAYSAEQGAPVVDRLPS